MGNGQRIKKRLSPVCVCLHIHVMSEKQSNSQTVAGLCLCVVKTAFQCSRSVFACRSMTMTCLLAPSRYLSLLFVCTRVCFLRARTGMSTARSHYTVAGGYKQLRQTVLCGDRTSSKLGRIQY